MHKFRQWAFVLAALCGVTLLLYLLVQADAGAHALPPGGQWLGWAAAVLVIAAVFGSAAVKLARYERRLHRLRRQQTEHPLPLPASGDRDMILYLRPFKTDNRRIEPVTYGGTLYSSLESLLCSILAKDGIPVAVGRPDEVLQPLGASRVYVGREPWKNTVDRLMRDAKYVILYVDFTTGVQWEIRRSLAACRDKLILLPKLFNTKFGLLRYGFVIQPFVLLYPLFLMLWKSTPCRRARRGRRYYRTWETHFGSLIPKNEFDDRISAVIFEAGKPRYFKAENPAVETQLQAVLHAIRYKIQGVD